MFGLLEELGLTLVTHRLPFRLNHVNCLLAENEDGTVKIIDAGLNDALTRRRWNAEIGGRTVSEIVITHYHPDHFGYAGGLQKLTKARLRMTATDFSFGTNVWQNDFIETIRARYALCGIPSQLARKMTENTASFVSRVTPYPEDFTDLKEGDLIQLGGWNYEVIETPGHADGLVCFYNRDKKVLLSTDHLLPHITPNISYWFHGDPDPLASYLSSLAKIKQMEIEYCIPSHGRPFTAVAERIQEIEEHHERRLDKTLAIVNKHCGNTVFDICVHLFRDDLTVHEMRFAIGETIAHLEYLCNRGELKKEQRNGCWHYERAQAYN